MTHRPSDSLRSQTARKKLLRQLRSSIPEARGVGLDGIHPSTIDSWPVSRSRALANSVSDDLRLGVYRFTSYREGLAPRGRGRVPRVFAIPTVRDRLALAALKGMLSDIYGISGPEPPQRKVSRVIDAVGSGTYSHYLKLDIQDYFGSIRHEVILARLARNIRSPKLLATIERALRNSIVPFGQRSRGLSSEPDGLPLGVSISSILAELYLQDFDASSAGYGGYFRYVDDILVLLRDDRSPLSAMQSELRRLGLSIHSLGTSGKTEYGLISEGFAYLGYHLNGSSVSVTTTGIQKVENQLASLISNAGKIASRRHSRYEMDRLIWRLNLVIGGCVIDGVARGWIRYYNRVDNLEMLGHLDGLVNKLLLRYKVPADVKIKRFLSAYWASRDDLRFHQYAFDLDAVDAEGARQHLVEHEGWQAVAVKELTNTEARAVFRRLVRQHVVDLERDLEPSS